MPSSMTTPTSSSSPSSTAASRRSYSPAASSSASASTVGISVASIEDPKSSSVVGGGSSKATAEFYYPTGPLPPSKPNNEFTRKPVGKGFLRMFVWRWRMWFESTFVLSMLEPWEKIMLMTIFVIVWIFFLSAIIKYMPHHITVMKRRAMYYLMGQEGDERLLRQWLGLTQNGGNNIGIVPGGTSGTGVLQEL